MYGRFKHFSATSYKAWYTIDGNLDYIMQTNAASTKGRCPSCVFTDKRSAKKDLLGKHRKAKLRIEPAYLELEQL